MKTAMLENSSDQSALRWKTILAPTDFSEPSQAAVRTAIGLAERCGAKIILLHVAQLPVAHPIEESFGVDQIVEAARESLEDLSKNIPPGVARGIQVRWGMHGAVAAIISAARELSADLVVIGTHGHRRLERLLLGSTAEKVVRLAPCPVLVVRRKEMASEPAQPKKD